MELLPVRVWTEPSEPRTRLSSIIFPPVVNPMTFVKLLEPFSISIRTFPVLLATRVILFSSKIAPTPYFWSPLISLNRSFIVVFESIVSSLPFMEKVPVDIVKPIFSPKFELWSCRFIDFTPFESM